MISVVIPAHNASAFVHRAIESVLRQSYSNWELLLVNNNSSDNTLEVLEDYRRKHPSKIFVFDEQKKGGAAARNRGLTEAKGKWIQFLDADDEIDCNKFERQMALASKSNPDLIIGSFCRVVSIFGFKIKVLKKARYDNVWNALITSRMGITSANLWKRECVLKVNGWDEGLSSSQEYDLMFRMLMTEAKPSFDSDSVSALVYFENDSVSRSKSNLTNVRNLNNYLELRLRIKEFLRMSGRLNNEIDECIDRSIYSYLIDKKLSIPEFVNQKLLEVGIDLPLVDRIGIYSRYYMKLIISKLT